MMSRKRSKSNSHKCRSNDQAKVYVGNVPTDQLSDQELLQFFKPFGKVLDIRVYHRYLFVQYETVKQANELIEQGQQQSLSIKGHRLDILPSMESSEMRKDSNKSIDSDDQSSLVYQPPRKRFVNDKSSSTKSVHCRILLVSQRQKNYAEEILSYFERKHLATSIEILDRECSFGAAVEHAKKDHCLYVIILTPSHQSQNIVSFHILHQQHKEHRNVNLDDAYEIILNDYFHYKSKKDFSLNSNDLPLPMLLCLLADGKQLTSKEIDRIITYLIEKKDNLPNEFQ